jgi:hypothetical protein
MAHREPVPAPSKGKASDPRVPLPLEIQRRLLSYQAADPLDIAVSDAQ